MQHQSCANDALGNPKDPSSQIQLAQADASKGRSRHIPKDMYSDGFSCVVSGKLITSISTESSSRLSL
ncbi:hypothetical protein EUGRSUZ_B02874 [Eucalyptus grandis]|uniref:Uncharacterized protein n=2 Tax=Eucalyptus grandis TaxID=71139 RepID=A0ACC3LVZ3_EUCGR|nr:hypothetical protein EUGRSUZ_B02874 [Eucalyptus grandis]